MSEANCVVSLSTSDGPFISGAELYTSLRGNCFLEDYLCCYLKPTSLPLLLKMKMQEGEETSPVISAWPNPSHSIKGSFFPPPVNLQECSDCMKLNVHWLIYIYGQDPISATKQRQGASNS